MEWWGGKYEFCPVLVKCCHRCQLLAVTGSVERLENEFIQIKDLEQRLSELELSGH